jgi:hypothetical protein
MLIGLVAVVVMAGAGGSGAQVTRQNPRPVERPSRTVEELLKRQTEAETAPAAAEGKGSQKKGGSEEKAAEDTGPRGGAPAEKSTPSVFRVTGQEVWEAARRAGWKFFPKGAVGALDGQNTVVEIQPGIPYSAVQGPVLTQRRTQAGWGKVSENTFFLFTDGRGQPRQLARGWTVQDLQLNGDAFQWVNRPQPGGTSPSLVIRMAGGRSARDSVVRLQGLVLQGPPGAKDWREAFAPR